MINETFYKGRDLYSDGDVEDEILSLVQSHDDFTGILAEETRWPVLYHLAPERRNLLDWYPFDRRRTLLEIGAGCGALTGMFCEKLQKVVAVELSRKRSQIIERRCRAFRNLEVMVGNFDDMTFPEPFDYVTLIGVLEYAKNFIRADRQYHHLLDKVGKLLSPDGRLIIAIENRYGLKYWAGSREDHTAGFFDGIEGYVHPRGIQETFGRREIMDLLNSSGFEYLQFYYPHPDYKMPLEIFSDHCLPGIDQILKESPNFDQDRMVLFSETLAFSSLIRNGMYDFFANSFLIIASKGKPIAADLHQI